MSIPSVLFAAAALAVSALLPLPAAAETPTPTPDPEEALDEGLKQFGYLAGLARGCVADEQQTDLEREALDLHAGIGRLLGTDRAFLFAAAFGYGTSVVVEIEQCKEVLSKYEERVQSFRAGRGAR
jgi:hypothetical protein